MTCFHCGGRVHTKAGRWYHDSQADWLSKGAHAASPRTDQR